MEKKAKRNSSLKNLTGLLTEKEAAELEKTISSNRKLIRKRLTKIAQNLK